MTIYTSSVLTLVLPFAPGYNDARQEDQVRRPLTDRGEKTPDPKRSHDFGEELFLGICENRRVGGNGIVVKTHLTMNIDRASL